MSTTWKDWRLISPLVEMGRTRPSIDERSAKVGSYYLERRHALIHRHVEVMKLNPDQTMERKLAIEFELPTDKTAICSKHEKECLYLFPVVFLRKAEKDASFVVKREDGASVPFPLRDENAWVSSVAAAHAASRLMKHGSSLTPSVASLQPIFHSIASRPSYDASVILDKLFRDVGRQSGGRVPDAWEETGFAGVLRLLMEHSLMWLTLRGRPGQRRRIVVEHEFDLQPAPVLRWRFGPLDKKSRHPILDTGTEQYGRRGLRISFGAIGQRLGQPLAWMPMELDFPTIYTRRCRSYHFELLCPPGLSPRDIKVAERLDGPANSFVETGTSRPDIHKSMKARSVSYHQSGEMPGDLRVRVTVGVGGGAFPILWTLAAAVTALLLWTMAATDPQFGSADSNSEIAAGILLIVPALLGAIVISTEHEAVTSMISGARILLLVTGLCAVAAAGVLIGGTPFGLSTSWTWTAYAVVATAATVPLATSWLLSLPTVWGQMERLETWRAHYFALLVGIAGAVSAIGILTMLGAAPAARVAGGTYLLLATVGLTLLANNRLSLPIGETRRYAAPALFAAALICLALACTELRAAIHHDEAFQTSAEHVAIGLLLLSPLVGLSLAYVTSFLSPKTDEIHVSGRQLEDLVARRRIHELNTLKQDDEETSSRDEPIGVF